MTENFFIFLYSILIKSTLVVSIKEFSSIVHSEKRCRGAARATEKMNVSIIQTVNDSIIVAVSRIFDHVVRNDLSGTRIIPRTVIKRVGSFRRVFRERDLPSIGPVNP